MNIIEIMEQTREETGIDVLDMMVVISPKYNVLKTISEKDKTLYIVTPWRTCNRCGKSWKAREEHPRFCGRCNSPYWDRPRRIKKCL